MNKLISTFEAIWVAITFAEAGEHVTSQQILAEDVHRAEDAEPCLGV